MHLKGILTAVQEYVLNVIDDSNSFLDHVFDNFEHYHLIIEL